MTAAVWSACGAMDTCDDCSLPNNQQARMKRTFIVGCPRSGTTWTALLLAQHPEIQACQQLGGVYTLDLFHRWWGKGERRPDARYHSSVVRFEKSETTGAPSPRYEALMTREELLGISRGLLDDMYALVEKKHPGCRVIVDTTPENIRFPELLVELMPDASFLHIIRDPRSVYASHRSGSKDFGAGFPSDPVSSARFWNRDVSFGRQLGKLTPNYREVRYETLKNNGAPELLSIYQWLGATSDLAACEAVLGKTTVDKMQGSSGTPQSFFRAGKAAGWRDELTDKQLHAVEYYARDLMIELGYEPAHPRSTRKPTGMVVGDLIEEFKSRAQKARRRSKSGV